VSEWLHIISDPAHVAAEATFACVEFVVGLVAGRFWLRSHDRRKH
jgi:hypothetical protein